MTNPAPKLPEIFALYEGLEDVCYGPFPSYPEAVAHGEAFPIKGEGFTAVRFLKAVEEIPHKAIVIYL